MLCCVIHMCYLKKLLLKTYLICFSPHNNSHGTLEHFFPCTSELKVLTSYQFCCVMIVKNPHHLFWWHMEFKCSASESYLFSL